MQCPYCGADDDKVVDSRAAEDGRAIRRRRECSGCGHRFTTYERVEEVLVRKRSGALEPFSREKLHAGIERAATDRLEPEAIEGVVAEIEQAVRAHGAEVPSEEVGMAALERLRVLDPVAYMRYASVYKGFEDLADFEREVGELLRRARLEQLEKTTAPKPRSS
jgi:transcriptional repressor NrdR